MQKILLPLATFLGLVLTIAIFPGTPVHAATPAQCVIGALKGACSSFVPAHSNSAYTGSKGAQDGKCYVLKSDTDLAKDVFNEKPCAELDFWKSIGSTCVAGPVLAECSPYGSNRGAWISAADPKPGKCYVGDIGFTEIPCSKYQDYLKPVCLFTEDNSWADTGCPSPPAPGKTAFPGKTGPQNGHCYFIDQDSIVQEKTCAEVFAYFDKHLNDANGTGGNTYTCVTSATQSCFSLGDPTVSGDTCGSGATAVNTSINIGCRGQGNGILDLTFAIIRFLSVGVGIIVVGSIVVAGIQFSASRGDPQMAAKAIARIQSSVIALLIYIFAYAILNFLIPAGIFK